MWEGCGNSHRLFLLARPILIIPALCGAFLCYTVLWVFFDLCPLIPVFTSVFIILVVLLIMEFLALTRFLARGVLDIECLVRCAGLVFALVVGFIGQDLPDGAEKPVQSILSVEISETVST